MPAVPDPFDAIAAQIDRLAPRNPAHSRPRPRQPAVDYSAIALDAPHKQPIAKRQQMIIQQGIIPTYYNLSGPTPGTVVGIVLGSVAGFLLIVWLLYSVTNGGGMSVGNTTAMAGQEEIVVRRRRGSHGGGRSRGSRHTQVREVSRSPRRSSGRSQIIVEERRAPPRARSIIVEERHHRVPGDDVVEVIEEHDEYRERRGSRRGGYR
tara:strand:+ start:14112 stop:14732 length:621 start_codon:yes stop_codon:yes gene_type:complete